MGRKNGKGRVIVLGVLCGALFALFLGRLVCMQFVRADEYAAKAQAATHAGYTCTVPAARGDITDCNGVVLAQDAPVYDVYLRWPAPPGTDLKSTLNTVLEVLQQEQQTPQGSEDVETQLAAFCSSVGAGEFAVAKGIGPAAAASLRATGLCGSGAVRLAARGERTWTDGALLPHVLGTVGAITASQWEDGSLQEQGYAMDDRIGQSGLEAACEQTLRGKSGTLAVEANRSTGALTETQQQAPVPGDTVVLTIDSALQAVVKGALQNQMETLRTVKPAGQGREVCAGAAVVVDTRTGGILASVSLPGYDLTQYGESYAALTADASQPLFDRVGLGQYAPGSAFKPAVAAAALASGTVSVSDTVSCGGRYTYYSGYQPRCLQLGHSGPVNLITALKYSCNIYFYDVGRRLGVDAFSSMAQALGLAADAGAELPAAAGRLTWSTDDNYQAGLTLQAAIGQANTAVSPLQLASYACTLANGGTRLRLHYVQAVRNAADGTVCETQPEVLNTVPGGEAVFGPIRQGMTEMSTTLYALRGFSVPLACKTGSPQRAERFGSGYYTNSVLIGYAPADAPRYAVAVVLEYGGGGANAAPVLRAVMDYLFREE
ncbi:MAG: peptidoglycan D,D-transpeptidase FtsI family protein [Gemmiger sp.]